MSRPPFPITEKSHRLRLVKSDSDDNNSQQKKADLNRKIIVRGIAYPVDSSGLGENAEPIGQYTLSTKQAVVEPTDVSGQGYLWEAEVSPTQEVAINEFQLLHSALEGPHIHTSGNQHWLMIQPQFKVRYSSTFYAAKLGEIRLVESQRFMTLDSGERATLLDTHQLNEPVLYLQDHEDSSIVRQQTPWQMPGESSEYDFDYRILQALQTEVNGQPVRSITVLEQYTSCFMERPLTNPLENSIWVPIYAAINWGWSMRVEPDSSGWAITRRKLMLPTVSHEEWQLPMWRSNTLEC